MINLICWMLNWFFLTVKMNKRRFFIIFFQAPFPLVSCMSTLIYNHYQVVYILQNISMFTFCRKMHTASVIMLSLSAISVCLCIMWYYLRFFMQYLCNLSFPLALCVSLSLSQLLGFFLEELPPFSHLLQTVGSRRKLRGDFH